MLTFPAPLKPGDTIAVTAPSAGVGRQEAERIDFCIGWLRSAGYEVVVGDCLYGSGIASGPAGARAAELTQMLCDPSIRCVIPPWGGETAIDLLGLPRLGRPGHRRADLARRLLRQTSRRSCSR